MRIDFHVKLYSISAENEIPRKLLVTGTEFRHLSTGSDADIRSQISMTSISGVPLYFVKNV
jgi:hypothetical protein